MRIESVKWRASMTCSFTQYESYVPKLVLPFLLARGLLFSFMWSSQA